MKELIEKKMKALEKGQLPTIILNQMKRKPTSWGDAPILRLAKMSDRDKKLIGKLKTVDWAKVYNEWPRSPAATDFDTKSPSLSFMMDGDDGRSYLISTEGANYARYVARIIP